MRRSMMPSDNRIGLRPPKIGSKIERHAIAVTTSGTIHGSSIRPVSTFRRGTRLLSSSAITMPTTSLQLTEATVKRTVFATAARYDESVNKRS